MQISFFREQYHQTRLSVGAALMLALVAYAYVGYPLPKIT